MKILFVSAVLPYPLYSGGQVRMYNLLRRLSKNHEITLVSCIRDYQEDSYKEQLNFCESVHTVYRGRAWQFQYLLGALGKYPFLLSTYTIHALRSQIRSLVTAHTFDLVHAEPFYVYPSLDVGNLPFVVSEHNIEYMVYKQFANRTFLSPAFDVDVRKLRYWEEFVWRRAAAVTAVSEDDQAIIAQASGKKVALIPNGVDVTLFPWQAPRKKPTRILFTGNFRWVPNRDAAFLLVRHIWPRIRNTYRDAQLRIVGVDVPKVLQQEVTQAGGMVVEQVDDISVEYRNADLLIAPHTIAGGTKYKMLEAMASGLPIITTAQGVLGLKLRSGEEYLEADSTEAFVEKTKYIWENREAVQKISRQARKVIETRFNWDAIAPRLESVWYETRN